MNTASWILCPCVVLGLSLLASPVLAGAAPAPVALTADDVMEISITELTQIDWRPGAKLPKKIAQLDGKKVRITGFMALETEEGTSDFRLTYDQCGCSNAKASHFVQVDLGDEETGYDPDEVTVEGVFSVGEEKEDGFVTSLFRLKADSID